MDLAEGGDARNVDMLVRDIYGEGEDRSGLKLPGDLTASFFARNIQQVGSYVVQDPGAESPFSRI